MPVKAPQIYIPTGYEAQQRAAERKRKIAQALMERGLATNPNMQSWTQVLGQLGNAWAGNRLDKKADEMTNEYETNLRNDYAKQIAAFQEKARGSQNDPNALQSLVESAQGNPLLADVVKPYADAYASRLKERENIVKTPTSYQRVGELEGKPLPNDPNAMVNIGPNGEWLPNKARIIASSIAGGTAENPNEALNYVGADPRAMQAPGSAAPPTMPQQPAGSGESDMVFSRMTDEEKRVVNDILQKYAGKGASVTSIVPQTTPYGDPTNPTMPGNPPAGVTNDGKPYWIINGVPYDNPEGR